MTSSDYCNSTYELFECEVNYTNPDSLDNLLNEYDIECADKNTLAIMNMGYFIGGATGSLTLPGLSDIYGRRKIFIFSLLVSITLFVIQLFLEKGVERSYYIFTATYVINGIMSEGRKAVGYSYFLELAPRKAA